jgi:hypothetical protein
MKASIFNTATGQILRLTTAPIGSIGLQLGGGEDWIEGHHADDQFYIDGYTPVPMGSPPSPAHVFNYTTKQWEDPRTLADLKAAKNAAINAARLKANQSHFTFTGKQIAVDALSRSDIDAAHGAWLMAGGPPPGWPGGWKAIDNTIIPIPDLPTWGAFYGSMVAQGTANFNHAQVLKAQLAAATTPAEVEAVPVW